MAQLVDWRFAQSTAALLGKTGPNCSLDQASEAVAQLRELAALSAKHVCDVTELAQGIGGIGGMALPSARVVDRRDWVAINAAGFQAVIEPVLLRHAASGPISTRARVVTSAATGVQLGAVLGFVSSRVLGQYETFSTSPGQLLLVAPNIMAAEQKLDVDSRDFRLWVCLHEVTHQVQFTMVPWLRGYFMSELEALLELRSPLDLLRSPASRARLANLTALMTLLEGHAEYVMDAVGPNIVASVAQIRAKFDARRRAGNPVQRLLRYVLGIEHKLRQYVEGKRFVTEVVNAVGMSGFNVVWRDPDALPSRAELSQPLAWLNRVQPAGVAG